MYINSEQVRDYCLTPTQ